MAYITTGLPNGGVTQFYALSYDDTLPASRGFDVALQLMNFCDQDYRLMTSWFRGAVSMPGQPLNVRIATYTKGATWWGWGPVYEITLGFGETVTRAVPIVYARYLLVSEVTEIFMRQRQFVPNYWYSAVNEGNKGEALSCFLAAELMHTIGEASLPLGFAKADSWLTSPRTNFLNMNDTNTEPDAENGCGINFLNYLKYQRGIAIADIIANGAETFEGVFENLGLGPKASAFPTFAGLVNSHYVQDSRLSATLPPLDNIFPVPELSEFIVAPQASWVNLGFVPRLLLSISRSAPIDVLVTFSTDRPDVVRLPADTIIRNGAQQQELNLEVKPQPAGFTQAAATLTASYAGQTFTRTVEIYAPSHWPMPPLQIVPEVPVDRCAEIFLPGSSQRFFIKNFDSFPNKIGLTLSWTVRNAAGTMGQNGDFTIASLPAAGTPIELTVVAQNTAGVRAEGKFDFTVLAAKTGLLHDIARLNCRIAHIVNIASRISRIPPLPPVEKQKIWKERLLEIEQHAEELTQRTAKLSKSVQKLSKVKVKKAEF